MAEALGVASAVAQIVAVALQVSQLSYSYARSVANASQTQRQYLQEVLALTEILYRLEVALTDSESHKVIDNRPSALSSQVIEDCHTQLETQRTQLEKNVRSLAWPFHERSARKAIDELHRFRNIFADFLTVNTLIVSSATLKSVKTLEEGQTRDRLYERLGPNTKTLQPPPSYLEGTGRWLIDGQEFQQWEKSQYGSILWGYGPPGVGKSCLASAIVKDLRNRAINGKTYVLHFFANYKTCKGQTNQSILQNLLGQLIKQADAEALSWLDRCQPPVADDLSVDNMVDILCSMRETLDLDIYIIVDGMDELDMCTNIASCLRQIGKIYGFRLLVTSRDHPDLRGILRNSWEIKIVANAQDLAFYIRSRIVERDFSWTTGALEQMIDAVSERANSIFLLARLILDQLMELSTIKKVKKALMDLPRTLEKAFETSLERINAQSTEMKDLAYRLIRWIAHTFRALSISEAINAFALELGDQELDPENMISLSIMLRTTAGLIVVDSETEVISFVHMSAYEYFVSSEKHKSKIHEDIAKTCLTCLSVSQLQNGPCDDLESMQRRFDDLPFLQYASQYWGDHVIQTTLDDQLKELVTTLLSNDGSRTSSFQALHFKKTVKSPDLAVETFRTLPANPTRLHIVAYWGLVQFAEKILADGEDVNAGDSQGFTPIHWAASNRHNNMLELLLREGASVNAADCQGWTAIHWASVKNDLSTFRALVAHGADINKADVHGWTPLHWALSAGSDSIINEIMILGKNNYNNSKGRTNDDVLETEYEHRGPLKSTAFEIAASMNDPTLFTRLLENYSSQGSDAWRELWTTGHFDPPAGNLWRCLNKAESINGVEHYIGSPRSILEEKWTQNTSWKSRLLRAAIKDDNMNITRLLIEIGADVNFSSARTALHVAAFRSDPSYVELLVRNGADVTSRDIYNQTPLQQAVINGFERTTKALLRLGSDASATRDGDLAKQRGWSDKTPSTQTCLMLACGSVIKSEADRETQTRILEMLIRYGADVHATDSDGRNCLHYASMTGNLQFTRRLVDEGVPLNKRDKNGICPLHLAAQTGDVDLIAFLADQKADTRLIDEYDRNCAHHLASVKRKDIPREDWERMLDLLNLDHGSDFLGVEFDNDKARGYSSSGDLLQRHTPLSLAAENETWPLFDLLLNRGAKLPAEFASLLAPAVFAQRADVVKYLIDSGAELQDKTSDMGLWRGSARTKVDRALHMLMQSSSVPLQIPVLNTMLQLLMSVGFSLEKSDIITEAAKQKDSAELAEVILRGGANPLRVSRASDDIDAFTIAALNGNLVYLSGLLNKTHKNKLGGHWANGLLPQDSTTRNITTLGISQAMQKSDQWDIAIGSGQLTILRRAIDAGNADLVENLILQGSNVEAQDEYGWRPLHWAVVKSKSKCARILVEIGKANVNAKTSRWPISSGPRQSGLYQRDEWHGTALYLATLVGDEETVAMLLAHGANVDAGFWSRQGHDHGQSVLEHAFEQRHTYYAPVNNLGPERLRIARMLLDHGAKIYECVQNTLNTRTFEQHFEGKGFEDVWERVKGSSVVVAAKSCLADQRRDEQEAATA